MPKKKKEPIILETLVDESKTGDIKTNDFNLNKGKIPSLSTIKSQIKQAETLINTTNSAPVIVEFDRLKIGINLIEHSDI